jgi:hypothetical protein
MISDQKSDDKTFELNTLYVVDNGKSNTKSKLKIMIRI